MQYFPNQYLLFADANLCFPYTKNSKMRNIEWLKESHVSGVTCPSFSLGHVSPRHNYFWIYCQFGYLVMLLGIVIWILQLDLIQREINSNQVNESFLWWIFSQESWSNLLNLPILDNSNDSWCLTIILKF